MKNRIGLLTIWGKLSMPNFTLAILLLTVITSVSAQDQTDIYPDHDAYLEGTASTRFNNDRLRVELNNRFAYMKFNLSGINGTITDVKLQLTVYSDIGHGNININKGSGDIWMEDDITATNKPGVGILLGSINKSYAVGSTETITLDKDEVGSGIVSLILTHTSGNDTDFASKDNTNTAIHPKLIVTYTPTPTTINVSSVSLDQGSLALDIGNIGQLTATVSPSDATDQTVSWSSDNITVATVTSSGLVTGQTQGTAIITVTTQDGNKTAQATINVTDSNAPILVTGVNLNLSSLDLEIGNTGQLSASIDPSNATNQAVTWSSSDTAIATINSTGQVTAMGQGSTTITVNTNDGNKQATATINVTDSSNPPSTGGLWSSNVSGIHYNLGNVGIGTTTPGTYKLAVNGTIHTKEVKVDIDGWADYVFARNYDLPTLSDVKKHIDSKGHLINIPSAMEVEANGIKLGEMNKLLLEKIEELTLYIIDQNKRINTLEQENIKEN